MLENLAKAIEQARLQGDPRQRNVLNDLRRQNEHRLRAEWEQQQRQAIAAQEAAERQTIAARAAARLAAPPMATASTARGGRPMADAKAISSWATPTTLRSQFLLTEILKPPLSMRPASGG